MNYPPQQPFSQNNPSPFSQPLLNAPKPAPKKRMTRGTHPPKQPRSTSRQPSPPKPPPPRWAMITAYVVMGVLAISLCICTVSVTLSIARGTAAQPTPTATTVAIAQGGASIPATAKPKPTAKPTQRPTTRPSPRPTPRPTTPRPTPTPSCQGINGNPWCYNFTPGSLIYNPASAFCSYFSCVSTFWVDTRGYVAECYNGEYTHSGGISGACSRDGGIERALYSH